MYAFLAASSGIVESAVRYAAAHAPKAKPHKVSGQRRRRGRAEMEKVRSWGRQNGYAVPAHHGEGRVPPHVIAAYDKAHPLRVAREATG